MDFGLQSFCKRSFLENAAVSVNGVTAPRGNKAVGNGSSGESAEAYLNQYLAETILVEGGEKEGTAIRISDLELKDLLLADWENTSVELNYETALTAPVEKGQIVGTAVFYIDEKEYASAWIKTESQVKKISLPYCFQKILKAWWSL